MNSFTLTLLVCASSLAVVSAGGMNEYCDSNGCPDSELCTTQGLGGACGGDSGNYGVTDDEIEMILEAMNDKRNTVAAGQASGAKGPQPPASNMNKLKWDYGLGEIAQARADQCIFEHDQCRQDPDWSIGFGQNLGLGPIGDTPDWTGIIDMWYNEIDEFDPSSIENYKFDPNTGHYTQLIWADTNKVGCGMRAYEGDNMLYVCNFGPSGNVDGESVYEIGDEPSGLFE